MADAGSSTAVGWFPVLALLLGFATNVTDAKENRLSSGLQYVRLSAQPDPVATAGTALCSLDGRRAISGKINDTSITIAITMMAGA